MKNQRNIIQTILNIAIVLFIGCFFIIRIKTGEYIPLPLVASILIVLVGISFLLGRQLRWYYN